MTNAIRKYYQNENKVAKKFIVQIGNKFKYLIQVNFIRPYNRIMKTKVIIYLFFLFILI